MVVVVVVLVLLLYYSIIVIDFCSRMLQLAFTGKSTYHMDSAKWLWRLENAC